MICMLWAWKAVRWWWWDVSGAVDKPPTINPFIWQPTPANHPVKLHTIQMFLFRIYVRICICWMAGGCCCYFNWSKNGGEWCSIGAVTLMTMMVVVALAVIVIEERVLLPTGSELSLPFPWLLSALAEVLSLYLLRCYRCRCCINVVVCIVASSFLLLWLSLSADVIFVIFVFRFHCYYCYLRCFRFSFSLLSRYQHRFIPLSFGLVASPPL